jgi:hypothetical protein
MLCSDLVEETWSWRDLPVLDAAVSLLDAGAWEGEQPDLADIAERTDLGDTDVAAALVALNGRFLTLSTPMGDISEWFVSEVTPQARREVGQWPAPDAVIARLADGLDAAADTEQDPDRKQRLRSVASALTGSLQGVATDVLARIIERSTGLG